MRVSSSLFTIAMGKISSKISFFADNWVHQKSYMYNNYTLNQQHYRPLQSRQSDGNSWAQIVDGVRFFGLSKTNKSPTVFVFHLLFFFTAHAVLHKTICLPPSCTFCVLAHRPGNMAFFIIEKYVTKRTTTSAKLSTKYHAKAW